MPTTARKPEWFFFPECDVNRITNETPIWTVVQDEAADLKIRTYPLASTHEEVHSELFRGPGPDR